MRIQLVLQSDGQIVPFDHQPLLVGTLHKWLGINEQHGAVSLCSFSRLTGGKQTPKGLDYRTGAHFFFSAHNPAVAKQIVAGVMENADMFYGLIV